MLKFELNHWATDLSLKYQTEGEIYDEDVINQSIESILSTGYGERAFNLGFGSDFKNRIFDVADDRFGERLLDDVVQALKINENRIFVDPNSVRLVLSPDDNTATITIPYIITMTGQKAIFEKRVIK